jgi:hypothetical protein
MNSCFVDAEHAVEALDHRDGRFADADDADFVRLDEADVVAAAEDGGERRGGHPAGGAAADDDDVLDWFVVHVVSPGVKKTTPGRRGPGRGRYCTQFRSA